jgi:hypothetical protein
MTTPPAQPDADPAASFNSLPSPLDAVDDLRAAARWTIVAAGAVGTALIGGAPLVAIGKVHGLLHAVIAGASLLVALAGVGLAIWQTSQVLVPPLTTPTTLSKPSMDALRKTINDTPWYFFGIAAQSIDDLLRHRHIAVNLARQLAAEQDPAQRGRLEAALNRVLANAERADPYVRWLLATAHVWQIREALRRAQRYTLIGGALIAVAAAAFFSVTGEQGPVYVPVVTPQITAVPTAHPT